MGSHGAVCDLQVRMNTGYRNTRNTSTQAQYPLNDSSARAQVCMGSTGAQDVNSTASSRPRKPSPKAIHQRHGGHSDTYSGCPGKTPPEHRVTHRHMDNSGNLDYTTPRECSPPSDFNSFSICASSGSASQSAGCGRKDHSSVNKAVASCSSGESRVDAVTRSNSKASSPIASRSTEERARSSPSSRTSSHTFPSSGTSHPCLDSEEILSR